MIRGLFGHRLWLLLLLLLLGYALFSWVRKRLSEPMPPEPVTGIILDTKDSVWLLTRPKDSEQFFLSLSLLLPEDAVLYFEDASGVDVISFLESRQVSEPVKVAKGTYGKVNFFHIQASQENLEGLAQLALRHAEPEICIHLVAYRNGEVLFAWYDAWSDPIYVSRTFTEEQIRLFCDRLGIKYKKESI